MIKFRCAICTQKISVNEEGIGVIITCPTCSRHIQVPYRTAPEFRSSNRVSPDGQARTDWGDLIGLSPSRTGQPGEGTLKRDPQAGTTKAELRAGVMPHLARMIMDKLVLSIRSQRAHLMDSQQAATLRVAEMERRLANVQEHLEHRLDFYEQQIAELQRHLAVKEEENGELLRSTILLAKQASGGNSAKDSSRVNLRDTGFLFRE